MRLLLSMGIKPAGDPGEPLHGALRVLDTDTGLVVDLLRPTPAHHPVGDHAELTGSRLAGDTLLQCTRTSVLTIDLATRRVVARLEHPLLHDVHDVERLPDGRVAVAATGHDSVLFFRDGTLDAHAWLTDPVRWGSPPAGFTEAFRGTRDFRGVPFDTFKPHRVHPNHLTWTGGSLWVTGLHDQRLRAIWPREGATVSLPGPPHDGLVHDGLVWLTTVDGHLCAVDPARARIVDTLRMDALDPTPGIAGWCRGLARVGDRLFVGMTTLRASAYRERVRAWLRGPAGEKRPTRVVEIDLRTRRMVGWWPVGNAAGGTLYAIHPWPLSSG